MGQEQEKLKLKKLRDYLASKFHCNYAFFKHRLCVDIEFLYHVYSVVPTGR